MLPFLLCTRLENLLPIETVHNYTNDKDCQNYMYRRDRMNNQAAPVQLSLLEKIKQHLNPGVMWEKVKESKALIVDMILFFGLGLLIGYMLKKYGQYFVMFLLFIASLIVLQQLNVVQVGINWAAIQDFFGIQHTPIPQGSTMLTVYWEWVKLNIAIVLSFSIGFLVGLRVA